MTRDIIKIIINAGLDIDKFNEVLNGQLFYADVSHIVCDGLKDIFDEVQDKLELKGYGSYYVSTETSQNYIMFFQMLRIWPENGPIEQSTVNDGRIYTKLVIDAKLNKLYRIWN